MIYGYARVSTLEQNLDSQLDALKAAGAEVIFSDKATGAVLKRPQLEKLLATVQAGDTMLVVRLDRLARSTVDLLLTLEQLAQKGVKFRSLTEPWADTTTPAGELVVTVMGGFAKFERAILRQRQADGIAAAKRKGRHHGRYPKLSTHQQEEICARLAAGEAVRDLARSYGVGVATIDRVKAKCAGGSLGGPTGD